MVLQLTAQLCSNGAASARQPSDRRCILYAPQVQSQHRVVQVSRTDTLASNCSNSVCFALLRSPAAAAGASDGSDASVHVSPGIWAALTSTDDAERDSNSTHLQIAVSDVDDAPVTSESPCTCKCGDIAAAELAFLDRHTPPAAVLHGLARVVVKLLQGSTVWDGQCLSVQWFNRPERVQLTRVAWREPSTGCCKALGRIASATQLTMRFAAATTLSASPQPALLSQPIDTYVAQLSQRLGGLDSYTRVLLRAMIARLVPASTSSSVSTNVGGVLCGLPGVGKTLLARSIGDVLGVHTTFMHGADVFQTFVGQSERQLVQMFETVLQHAPSVLIIDGIEAIAGARAVARDAPNALEVGVLGTFVACLDQLKHARVFVLGTTSHLDVMDAAVTSNGRLDLVVQIEPPSQRERLAILRVLTQSWPVDNTQQQQMLERVSDATGGYVGADLLRLCQQALQFALLERSSAIAAATVPDTVSSDDSDSVAVLPEHFERALAMTFPSVLQTHQVVPREPSPANAALLDRETSDDALPLPLSLPGVYGMTRAVQTLQVSLFEPLADCRRFLAFGTVPPRGILLTGPPGSGKSHLAHAVADVVQRRGLASFVSVNCTDLLAKVVGDTESALRTLFATARNAAPCVLYFDQIETIAPVRGFDTSTEQTFDRMLSMLLVEMDGFSSAPVATHLEDADATDADARDAFLKQHVVILASTTRKELLDPSILRPGRFDVHIDVTFPDESAREQIALDALATIPIDYTQDVVLRDPRSVAAFIAKHTSGKSAGDVRAVLREAAMASMREQMDAATVAIKFVKQAMTSDGDVLSRQFSATLPLAGAAVLGTGSARPSGRNARPKPQTLKDRRLRGR